MAANPGKTIATRLVDLALARYDLGLSGTGQPFLLPKDGTVNWTDAVLLTGHSATVLRCELAAAMWSAEQKVPARRYLNDALEELGFLARGADSARYELPWRLPVSDLADEILADVVFRLLRAFLHDRPDHRWEGSAAAWQHALTQQDPDVVRAQGWPRTPRALSQRFNELASGLKTAGWEVHQRSYNGVKLWGIASPPAPGGRRVPGGAR